MQVTPIKRDELPRTAADIMHRINEISFNSSLMREMRAVAFATKLIDDHELDEDKHSRMFMHWIGNDGVMAQLGTATQVPSRVEPAVPITRRRTRDSEGMARSKLRACRLPLDGRSR